MKTEMNSMVLRATYQSFSHYQEAIGILEMANQTQKKVFVADNGEVRFASLWDRFSEKIFSLFGYVNHTSDVWINSSVKALVDFGKNRWTDKTLMTKVHRLASYYNITPSIRAAEEVTQPAVSKKTMATDVKESILNEIKPSSTERAKPAEEIHSPEGENPITLLENEEGKAVSDKEKEFERKVAYIVEMMAQDPRFAGMKLEVNPVTKEVVLRNTQTKKTSLFSFRRLILLAFVLYGSYTWRQSSLAQKNAQKALVDYEVGKSGNLTSIFQFKVLPELPEGYKWLDLALENQDVDLAKELVDRGARSDLSLLLHCAKEVNQEMFSALMSEKGLDLTIKNEDGITLLHAAAANDDPEVLNYLLDKQEMKKMLNEQALMIPLDSLSSMQNATPLAYAIIEGKEDNIQLLLQRGADPLLKCQLFGKEYTALELANYAKGRLAPEEVERQKVFDRIIHML